MWKSKKKRVVEIQATESNGCNGFHHNDHDNEDGVDICTSTTSDNDMDRNDIGKVEGYFHETATGADGKSTAGIGSAKMGNGHSHNTSVSNGNGSATKYITDGMEKMVLENGSRTTELVIEDVDKHEAQNSNSQLHSNFNGTTTAETEDEVNNGVSPLTIANPLWPEIDRVTRDQLHYAKLGVGEGGWSLFAKDGEMKMYKREVEEDGLIMDPLKAVHTVKGVTAHEMCHYFFSPEVRTEWETTLETMTILETISEDAIVFHQVHTRIWPATQRDALFWSHIRQLPDGDGQTNTWIVCNHSSKHEKDPEAPAPGKKSKDKYIRILLKVSLVCQTVIDPAKAKASVEQITRDDLTCHISYCSVVHPGGWAPAAGVRAVYKREYPRFLKKFTQYVFDKCKDKPIMF